MKFPKINTTNIGLVYAFFYFLYVEVLSSKLEVSLSWIFIENWDYTTYLEWFPKHYFVAFILLKIIPFLGLITLVAFITKNFKQLVSLISGSSPISDTFLSKLILLAFIITLFCFHAIPHLHNVVLLTGIIIIILGQLFHLNRLKGYDLTILILLAIALRLLYFYNTGPFDIQNDSLARIAQIYSWDKYGGIPGSLIWPFGHHFLIYGLAKIFNASFEVAGQLLSLISSIILIPFAYKLFKLLFNKTSAFLTVFFYAVNPFFIKYATIQMTEIPFICLMVIGVYYAYKYFNSDYSPYLLFSAMAINLTALLRFEAWIIIPIFALIFAFKFTKPKQVILWGCLVSISTILFAIASLIIHGNPIYGVTLSDIEVIDTLSGKTIGDSFKILVSWPWIPLYFIPLIFLSILSGIKKGENQYYIIFLSVLGAYYLFKISTLTLMPFWRYFSFIIIFLTPLMFYYLSKKVNVKLLALLFLVSYGLRTSNNIINVYESYEPLPDGFFESAIYFRENYLSNMESKIILSMDPFSGDDMWKVYSGMHNDFTNIQKLHAGSGANPNNYAFTTDNLKTCILEKGYDVILVQKGHELDELFNDPDIQQFLSLKELDTNTFKNYTLFKIN